MNNKKISILASIFFMVLNLVACGQVKKNEFVEIQQENSMQESKSADSEIKKDEDVNTEKSPVNQQERSTEMDEDTPIKMTAEELLDAFIDGSVDAVDTADPSSAWNISDLNKDSQGEEFYSIGERVDLDNDGENELVICGPYGGIYLDCRDDKVYEFARGDGSANVLSYTYYNGDVWIMYSNDMNAGYETYHMEKYEGADNLAAEMNFGEELIDENDPDSGMKYFWNGKEVSNDEYDAFCSKIFAAQENTN